MNHESTPKIHFPLPVCRQAGIPPRLCVAATAEQGRGTYFKLLIYNGSPLGVGGSKTIKNRNFYFSEWTQPNII